MRLVIDLVGRADRRHGGRAAGAGAPRRSRRRPTFRRRSVSPRRRSAPSRSIPATAATTRACKSADGAKEKDLTLAIARRVKGVDRGASRPPRPADARRRPQRSARRADGGRQQQQGRSVHQPARERIDAAVRRTARSSSSRPSIATPRRRRPARGERLPTFGGGSRDIELVPWDLAQTRHLDQSVGIRRPAGAAAPRPRAAGGQAGRPRAAARARIGQHAGGAGRDGLPDEPRAGKDARRRRVPERVVQALFDAVVQFRDTLSAGGDALMARRAAVVATVAAILFVAVVVLLANEDCPRRPAARRQPRRRRAATARRQRRAARSRRGCSTSPTMARG